MQCYIAIAVIPFEMLSTEMEFGWVPTAKKYDLNDNTAGINQFISLHAAK